MTFALEPPAHLTRMEVDPREEWLPAATPVVSANDEPEEADDFDDEDFDDDFDDDFEQELEAEWEELDRDLMEDDLDLGTPAGDDSDSDDEGVIDDADEEFEAE